MNTYIADADRTSAPVDPVMNRLAMQPQSLTSLFFILSALSAYAAALDKWKAWAYYGKGQFPVPPRFTELPGEMPTMALEKALEVIPDMHFLEILHAAIGIGSEAGEMIESLLPALFDGKPLDTINVHEESGDLLWYLAKLFKYTGTDFERVMAANIAKLRARFPQKFTEEAAQNRDLGRERTALEGGENENADLVRLMASDSIMDKLRALKETGGAMLKIRVGDSASAKMLAAFVIGDESNEIEEALSKIEDEWDSAPAAPQPETGMPTQYNR